MIGGVGGGVTGVLHGLIATFITLLAGGGAGGSVVRVAVITYCKNTASVDRVQAQVSKDQPVQLVLQATPASSVHMQTMTDSAVGHVALTLLVEPMRCGRLSVSLTPCWLLAVGCGWTRQ